MLERLLLDNAIDGLNLYTAGSNLRHDDNEIYLNKTITKFF